jgi:hypothetical protein
MSKVKWAIIALPNRYCFERGCSWLLSNLPDQPNRLGMRSVCPAVWEGGNRETTPYPDGQIFLCMSCQGRSLLVFILSRQFKRSDYSAARLSRA